MVCARWVKSSSDAKSGTWNLRCCVISSTPIPLDFKSEESLYHDHSSGMSSWESDVSLCAIFENLSVNMVSTSHLEEKKWRNDSVGYWSLDQTLEYSLRYTLWVASPPTEEKVVQINMGSEANPKPIFISESLSPSEKEELIHLIWEYIDVFAWDYEDMPSLDPQVAMHRLNISLDVKPVKQQRWFCLEIMEAIKSEVRKTPNSSGRSNILIGLPTLFSSLKRMERFEFV